MNKIEELEKELAAFNQHMKNELRALHGCDQEKQPAEWPQEGDSYWVGAYETGVSCFLFKDDTSDKYFKAIGDMHKTKEEAEAYRKYRINPRTVMRDKIQMFVEEYNGGERGFYEIDQDGHTLCGGRIYNPFAMKDREGAELLLEKFGLDNILWACGGPEPGGE